jgi:hypothetical protein
MTRVFSQSQSHTSHMLANTYSEVATGTSTFGNDIADLIGEVLPASNAGDCLLDVELDRRHCCELMYGMYDRRRVVVEPDGWARLTKHSRYRPLQSDRRPPPGSIFEPWTEVHSLSRGLSFPSSQTTNQ